MENAISGAPICKRNKPVSQIHRLKLALLRKKIINESMCCYNLCYKTGDLQLKTWLPVKVSSIRIKKRKNETSTSRKKNQIKCKRVPMSLMVSRIKQQRYFWHQKQIATLQPDLNRHSWYTNNVLPIELCRVNLRMARLELASPVPKTGMLLLHTFFN